MSTRTLSFPEQAVGSVEEIRSGRTQPAAGSVTVASGEPVRLVLERDHREVLLSLGPDDVQGLALLPYQHHLKAGTISALSHLTGLVELHAVCQGKWDDEACEVLSGLTNLRGLGILRAVGVTDRGFERLAALTELVRLRIEHSRITDGALAALDAMPRLSDVNLGSSRALTGDAVRQIAARPLLSQLFVDGAPGVGDDGLAHLSGCRSLRVVGLSNTGVTVEGLRHLPANDPPIRIMGSPGLKPWSRADWRTAQERYPHLDFGGIRELTADASIRDRVREHGTPLAGLTADASAPLLAIFTTDSCVPCERMLPIVQELGRQWFERMTTVQVHCPDHPEIAQALSIQSAPTLVLFTGPSRTVRLPGSLVLEELKADLAPYLGLAIAER